MRAGEVPIDPEVSAGCDLAGLAAKDVAEVAMGAAAWACGFPIVRNENLVTFRETVNRVLDVFGLHFDFEGVDGAGSGDA